MIFVNRVWLCGINAGCNDGWIGACRAQIHELLSTDAPESAQIAVAEMDLGGSDVTPFTGPALLRAGG